MQYSHWSEAFDSDFPGSPRWRTTEEAVGVRHTALSAGVRLEPEADSLVVYVHVELEVQLRRQVKDAVSDAQDWLDLMFEGKAGLPSKPAPLQLELSCTNTSHGWKEPGTLAVELRPIISYSVIRVVDEADEARLLPGVSLQVAGVNGNAFTLITDERGEISLPCHPSKQCALLGLPDDEQQNSVALADVGAWELQNA